MKKKFLKVLLSFTIFSSFMLSYNENNIVNLNANKTNNFALPNQNKNDSVVFIDVDDNQKENEIELATNSNQNKGTLFSKFYLSNENEKDLVEGELYKTKYDTKESLNTLKEFITNKANNNTLLLASNYDKQEIDYGNFTIGSSFIPLKNKTTIRAMSCTYNGNMMGVITDYENIFVLNNPNNSEVFYLLVTHQTYLSPTQTVNRNFKGVGVEFKLSKDTSSYNVTRYAPTTSAQSKVTSFSSSLGVQIGDQTSASANISFSYQKNVSSPTISSKGSISQGIVDA